MAEPYDAQLIQKQLDDVNQLLMKAINDLVRINAGQTSLVLRDLAQVTSSDKNLSNRITGYLDENQRHVMTLVGVGSVIN